jgi:iron complex transport system ATP-binding protein
VLENISLSLPDSSFVVLLGKNGSGKSTLLKILSGILPYEKGAVSIDNRDLNQFSPKERSRMLGYLPQHFRMVFPFSVEEVVMTGRAAHVAFRPGKKDRAMVREAMERSGIIHLRNRPFTEISGGEQQLARIARVLSQAPSRILLDEPATHLDLFNQARVLGLLEELVDSGLTVVAVLHDPNAAFVYEDHFVLLKDGKRYAIEAHQQPWDETVLQHVYDIPLECVPYRDRALVAPALHNPVKHRNNPDPKKHGPPFGQGTARSSPARHIGAKLAHGGVSSFQCRLCPALERWIN